MAWQEGHTLDLEALSTLSPYRTESIALGIMWSIPIDFRNPWSSTWGFQSPDETRRSRFLLLGFCSLLRCNKRAAFLLRCSRLCLFLRRLLLRSLWRFVAHTLKLPPLVRQTRALNRPTFGIAPLTFGSQPCLNRGSQIGKTKLSVRKAEERHSKEGQEGRKEAPQAPALRSISAYGGDEVSHYDETRKDNSPENSPVS